MDGPVAGNSDEPTPKMWPRMQVTNPRDLSLMHEKPRGTFGGGGGVGWPIIILDPFEDILGQHFCR